MSNEITQVKEPSVITRFKINVTGKDSIKESILIDNPKFHTLIKLVPTELTERKALYITDDNYEHIVLNHPHDPLFITVIELLNILSNIKSDHLLMGKNFALTGLTYDDYTKILHSIPENNVKYIYPEVTFTIKDEVITDIVLWFNNKNGERISEFNLIYSGWGANIQMLKGMLK